MASNLDFLGGLGSAKYQVEGFSMNAIEATLHDFADKFINACVDNLNKSHSVDTGNLASNIKQVVEYSNGVYSLKVLLPDYYDYVNKGVKGVSDTNKAPNSPYQFKNLGVSKKMLAALSGWTNRHNLKAKKQNVLFKHKKAPTFDESNTTAYIIARAIKRKGLKPTFFFDNAYKDVYPELPEKLAAALKTDMIHIMRQIKVIL